MRAADAFNALAEAYDDWYEAPLGEAVLCAELDCLRRVMPDMRGRWLEVGVGTGRFAGALGIQTGADPAPTMAAKAAARGLSVQAARAEALPYRSGSFAGVLLVLTLCFVEEPHKAFAECERVLAPGGNLVLGMVPADSPWGEQYQRDGRHGHPIYSHARFHTLDEAVQMARKAGFSHERTGSALFCGPSSRPEQLAGSADGALVGAGFVGLRFARDRGGR
jgi:SAM-dependent methyltransferase